MPDLFLEIGSEEIPAGYLTPALNYLERELTGFLNKSHISLGSLRKLGTPRRLVIACSNMEARQKDVLEKHLGPNVKIAFDSEGKPTKAAIGFARGKGIDVSALERESTPKGEVLCARIEKKGQATRALLEEYLPQLICALPFPKKMRWGSHALPYARPLHWVTALFGRDLLNFEVGPVVSSNTSRGHRFLNPELFSVDGLDSYLTECKSRNVMIDPEERKQSIQAQVKDLARGVKGQVADDPELLDEVNFLVEYPYPVLCDFESAYLELPKELLVITMRHHQRYFPVEDAEGKLLPYFITISNMEPGPGQEIKNGNERVLRARLEDARFFYEEDKKRPLESYVDRLQGVVFQKDLGTSYEKMERFSRIAQSIAESVYPEGVESVQRAARLCKADLETQMVYEFPELQGIMGGYYATHSNESSEVAKAIQEHYRPAFSGDDLPSTPVGAIVAVADKLDTILGCIGVGLLPSGSEDPYGLRRHSLGIIQIVQDRGWAISLDQWIDIGLQLLSAKIKLKPEEIRQHTLDLFQQRFKSMFNSEGFPYDAVDAVLSTGIDSFVDVRAKVAAFSDLKKQSHFEPLAIAFRRVVSILKEGGEGEVDPALFQEAGESNLFEAYQKISGPVEQHIRNKEFAQALEKIVEIKPAVDGFFDQVMVMVEDERVKKNRLALLKHISGLFSKLADFSKIVVKKN